MPIAGRRKISLEEVVAAEQGLQVSDTVGRKMFFSFLKKGTPSGGKQNAFIGVMTKKGTSSGLNHFVIRFQVLY